MVTIFCSRMLILLEKRQIKASGRRAGSEIAANGATDASANGGTDVRQTKARMFRQTAGDHPETIIKGDNYSDTPSVLSVLSILSALSSHQQTARANDVKCRGKRQAKVAANGKTTQRQTEKKSWLGMSGTWCKSIENRRSLINTPGQESKRQKAI